MSSEKSPSRAGVLAEEVSDRAAGRLRRRIELSRAAVLDNPAVHHLAHYSGGADFDFEVDVLDHPTVASGRSAAEVARRRELYRRVGRQIAFAMSRTDAQLQKLGTGDLIRMVLQGTTGAVCCNSVVPGTYVVAATAHEAAGVPADTLPSRFPHVEAADRALSGLVTEMRKGIRQGLQNPGGWETSNLALALADAHVDDSGSADGPVSDLPPRITGDQGHPLLDECRRAVDRGPLHYLAYYGDGMMTFAVDRLGDERLDEYFTVLTVEARRRLYEEIGEQLGGQVQDLARSARAVVAGPLARVVLDVEQGAIYYYRISAADYLVGVTLDQSVVSFADDAVAEIALTHRES